MRQPPLWPPRLCLKRTKTVIEITEILENQGDRSAPWEPALNDQLFLEISVDSTRAGEETTAYCTACKEMRQHVVVAMDGMLPAKVECLSCHRQHKFRAAAPGTKVAGAAKARSSKPDSAPGKPRRSAGADGASGAGASAVNPLDALLAGRSTTGARSYSPGDSYVVGELLAHPNFGLGAVTATPSPGKISVQFRDSMRLLLHQRTSVTAAGSTGPRLEPPVRRETSPEAPSERPPKVRSIL